MHTDFMVVGRVRNGKNLARLADGIRSLGYSCYSCLDQIDLSVFGTWNNAQDQVENHQDFWNSLYLKEVYQNNRDGLFGAKTVVLLLPAGLDSHAEIGRASGLGKKVVLIGEPEKPETIYYVFGEYKNERFPDIENFLNSLR